MFTHRYKDGERVYWTLTLEKHGEEPSIVFDAPDWTWKYKLSNEDESWVLSGIIQGQFDVRPSAQDVLTEVMVRMSALAIKFD